MSRPPPFATPKQLAAARAEAPDGKPRYCELCGYLMGTYRRHIVVVSLTCAGKPEDLREYPDPPHPMD